ncbi:MAG TPA: biotin--[acetyl-CoA-carboxylase] ligase [Aurantimonas sp.]|nr:biotin--[acetyl-CoA-carboxylase] ligase [Aurantimonas sp.]
MAAASSGQRRLALGATTSTNSVAIEAARAGDPGALWVTAERQTAGRGRRGRSWVSEAGNLYASLLLIDPAPLRHLGKLPLVASLGVRDGLATLLPDRAAVAVKWPNDVLIGGAKAVGILLESERLPDGRMAVVIGCGVNVSLIPDEAPYSVTSLAREGATDLALETVFAAVAAGLSGALTRFDRGSGFDVVRREWLHAAVGVGGPCRVVMADRTLTGRFEALDEEGRLILLRDEDSTRMAVSAGDLFFPEAHAHRAPSDSAASAAMTNLD